MRISTIIGARLLAIFNLRLNKKPLFVNFNYDVSLLHGVSIHILHESESSMIRNL